MRSIRHTPTMCDPRTGIPLKPLGRRKDGRQIWPIMGGSGEGEGEGGDGTGDGATGDADKAGDGADADKGKADDTGKTEDTKSDKQDDDAKTDDKTKTFDETYVKKLRDEAAENRTEKQQLKGVLDAINKALNPDAKDEDKVDPVKLAADLGSERTAHTNLQREHQVLLTAITAGADHSALLDSRSFLAKVANLDPTADDFAGKVKAAIEAAVKDNPKLKSAQAVGSSSADHSGGSGGGGKKTQSLPLDQAYAQHYGS